MRQVHSSLAKSEKSNYLILPGHSSQLQVIEMTQVDLSGKEFILKLQHNPQKYWEGWRTMLRGYEARNSGQIYVVKGHHRGYHKILVLSLQHYSTMLTQNIVTYYVTIRTTYENAGTISDAVHDASLASDSKSNFPWRSLLHVDILAAMETGKASV